MKRIMKKYCSVIVSLVMLVTCMTGFFSGMEATASDTSTVTKEDGVKYILYDDISTYRTTKDDAGYYTKSPELSGYVFGGWFATSDEISSIGTETSGGAWAKFVPQDTFTIKAQISIVEPATASLSDLLTSVEKVNLRFVTGVDSLKYKKVIFQVTHLGQPVTKEMTSVMSQIDVKTGEDDTYQSKKASDVFGTAAEYFATLRFTGIAASTANGERYQKDWTVTPMLVTQDGTLVNGVTREGLKIADAVTEKFQVASKTEGVTADSINGKVIADHTSKDVRSLYFATDNETNSSTSWEITGTMSQSESGMKLFILQTADGTKTEYYTMYDNALIKSALSPWDWRHPSDYPDYVFNHPSTGLSYTHGPLKFKAVIENDQFTLWIEDQRLWSVPLTHEMFGGFAAGTSYRMAIGSSNGGGTGQAEWSDLTVKYEEKFQVASKTEGVITDSINGKVIADHTSKDVRSLYFATDNETNSSTSWEITGTMSQSESGMKLFILQTADGTKTEYYTIYDNALIKNEIGPWDWRKPADYPDYVFNNPSSSGVSYTHNPLTFKAVIENDQFTFWIEDQRLWSVPLTHEMFGGFAAGTSYRMAIGSSNGGGTGQVEWSDLTVKYGEDVQ